MIELGMAIELLGEAATVKGTERVNLLNSFNRVIAGDIAADSDIPPFDRSAMDGYACRFEDVNNHMSLNETIPAGVLPGKIIQPGTCSKIMTGAMLPPGADCVIKVEDTFTLNDKVVFRGELKNNNIRFRGEDAGKGEVLIPSGTIVKPQHIAVMASVGEVMPLVYMQPTIAVISTGNELIEPEEIPAGASIRNSNGSQLISQLLSIGLKGDYLGIIKDDREKLFGIVKRSKSLYDVLLISGGVSMGDYDYVPEAMEDAGYNILIKKVSVRPGKPLIFGSDNSSFCFGVPGNPVSSFVQFELLIKPFLLALQGHRYSPRISVNEFGIDHKVKKFDQPQFIPVKIRNGVVEPVFYKGSGHIASFAAADGLMEIAPGKVELNKGEQVNVRLL